MLALCFAMWLQKGFVDWESTLTVYKVQVWRHLNIPLGLSQRNISANVAKSSTYGRLVMKGYGFALGGEEGQIQQREIGHRSTVDHSSDGHEASGDGERLHIGLSCVQHVVSKIRREASSSPIANVEILIRRNDRQVKNLGI